MSARLAKFYVKRGQLRVEQPNPALAEIVRTPAMGSELAPDLRAGHGLLADAYLRQAQTQPSRAELAADLTGRSPKATKPSNPTPMPTSRLWPATW